MTLRNGQQYFPRRTSLLHLYGTVANGAALVHVNSDVILNFYSHQVPAAINDAWKYDIALEKGLWYIYLLYWRTPSSGIVTFSLLSEDTSIVYQNIGSLDLYGTSLVSQSIGISFTVTRDNYYVLQGQIAGKHASSTGYQAAITLIEIMRTPP